MAHHDVLPAAGSLVLQQIKEFSDELRPARSISSNELNVFRPAFRARVPGVYPDRFRYRESSHDLPASFGSPAA